MLSIKIYSLIILTQSMVVHGSPFYQMCFEETNKKRQQQGLPPLQANAVIQMQTQEYANRVAAGLVAVPKVDVQKSNTIFVPNHENGGIVQSNAMMFNPNQNTLKNGNPVINQADNQERRPYAFHGRRTGPEPNAYDAMQQYATYYQKNAINNDQLIDFNQNPIQNYMNQGPIHARSNAGYINGDYMPISNGNANPVLGSPQNSIGQMPSDSGSEGYKIGENYLSLMNLNGDSKGFNPGEKLMGQTQYNDPTRGLNIGGNYASIAGRNLNELSGGNPNGPKKLSALPRHALGDPNKIFFESPQEMVLTLKNSVKIGCAIAKNPNGGAIVVINYQ